MDRTADVFIVSRTSWQTASILHVLSLRQAEVRRRPAPSQGQDEEAVILDKGACFRVDKSLYREYLQEPETRTLTTEVWQRALRLANERRAKGQRSSQKELYERSMRSYWKTTVFNRYGGEIWLSTLIATGRVHHVSVQIVNDIFAERIREKAEREPISDPTQAQPQSKAPASSQGQVKGVQHQKILAGELRDKARLADKEWKWHDVSWWKASRGRLGDDDVGWWSRKSTLLQETADRCWARAGEESIKAGHPFKDRDGTTFHPGPQRLGTFERSLKILVERIKAGEVTWPPAP